MKKLLSVLLILAMTLSICACGGAETPPETTEAPKTLEIGFGRINATPSYPVSLHGYGEEELRITSNFTHYIYITCIAARYGEDTILFYTLDIGSLRKGVPEQIRLAASEATGIPGENIFFGATHTHSGPSLFHDSVNNVKYQAEYYQHIASAAKLAIKDLAETTVSSTQFEIEGMNFVRHYLMNDGTYAGSNFGDSSSGYKEHTYDVNHEMIFVNFKREGKDDVLLVNWAAHPANPYDEAIGNLNISADHPGWARDELEKLTGAKVAYFNGASGDVVVRSSVESLKHGLNAKEYGEKLAQLAYEHYDELKPLEVDAVKATQYKATVNVEHELEHLIPQCLEIKAVRSDRSQKDKADQMARDIGLSSAYHATAIITRSKMGATSTRTLNTFRIGPVSFTTGTYEMASEHAAELKAASPYEFTFQICGNQNYIPREEAIDYHSYEGDTRRYTRETGDVLVQKYLEMLTSIK